MNVTWHGQYTIKIVTKGVTIVLDPHAAVGGQQAFRAKADIVALTNPSDTEMSYVRGIQGTATVIETPGEYSFHNMTLHGIGWIPDGGSERSMQRWTIEGMVVVHVGALTREPTDSELRELERTSIDILIVPVGGGSGLSTNQALKLVTTIEPKVVIPIHYKTPKTTEKLSDVKQFAREMGVSSHTTNKNFSVRQSQLPQEDVETILLEP